MREYHHGLVSAETLFENLDDGWVIFDCRHSLRDPEAGPRDYAKRHIPGAFHAHVDRDLSGPAGSGGKGRHPLPISGVFCRFLQTFGVNNDTQVVCYDDDGGMWAARLWWLLRHHGHENVAVLDGGLQRWRSLALPITDQRKRSTMGTFEGVAGHMPVVQTAEILAGLENGEPHVLLDARAPERFHGEVEPIDPKAGHIPGAINAPYAGNLDATGMFLSPDELRVRYEDSLAGHAPGNIVAYCGSGVTAAHDILAMEIAGLGTTALYPGSWSEWCHPEGGRPVEVSEPEPQPSDDDRVELRSSTVDREEE